MTTRTLGRAAPLRFLIGVALCWTLGRVIALTDWSGEEVADPETPRRLALAPMMAAAERSEVLVVGGVAHPPRRPDIQPSRVVATPASAIFAAVPPPVEPEDSALALRQLHRPEQAMIDAHAVASPGPVAASRWSGSAWAFVRGGGRANALAPVGQIGGGQAGTRWLYRLDERGGLALSGRVSRAIGGPRQTEAALGLDWKPMARLPVHLMIERRVAIDRGGRDAWTLGVAGGVDAVPLAEHWRLDGYGEAGVVGARRRDAYADGALRVARSLDLGDGASLALGGGLWGAVQPGAARLDLGPSAVLRLPVVGHAVALALDWRERVAGDARPGSGIAFTAAMDF